jgi:hypothetical protein
MFVRDTKKNDYSSRDLYEGGIVQLPGQGHVLGAKSPTIMSYERHADLVVANVDIGVVGSGFGQASGAVDEIHSGYKIRKSEGPDNVSVFQFPSVQILDFYLKSDSIELLDCFNGHVSVSWAVGCWKISTC